MTLEGLPIDKNFKCPYNVAEVKEPKPREVLQKREIMQKDDDIDTLITPFLDQMNDPNKKKDAFISTIRICCGCDKLQEIGLTGRSCSNTKCGGLANDKPCPIGNNEPSWNPPRSFNQIIPNVYVQLKDNIVERAYMNENPLFERQGAKQWKRRTASESK